MFDAPVLLPVPEGPLVVRAATSALGPPVPLRPSNLPREEPRPALSLVIPTYNESANIAELLSRLTVMLDVMLPGRYEMIVVDDDSPDRTWEVVSELAPRYPYLRVMRRVGERGLSTAVVRGWQVSRGDALGVIDADLQHPPEVLAELVREVENGADLAVASRHVERGGVSDWKLSRRLVSRGAQALGLLLLPSVLRRVKDPMSGYFVVRRAAIQDRALSPVGYKILLEVLGRGDVDTIKEVGYVFRERAEGNSKVTTTIYLQYLQHLAKLRFG